MTKEEIIDWLDEFEDGTDIVLGLVHPNDEKTMDRSAENRGTTVITTKPILRMRICAISGIAPVGELKNRKAALLFKIL